LSVGVFLRSYYVFHVAHGVDQLEHHDVWTRWVRISDMNEERVYDR
jgi:hypothetical protein